MPAHITYEIKGRNSAGKEVSILIKAVTTPTPEVALWLLKEKYPSVKAETIEVSLPAVRGYPPRSGPVTHRKMESTPIRRTR